MLQAQRWDSTDADAHVVLGVLYNVSRNYDSAAEAFRRALEARPNDHSLWNKVRKMCKLLIESICRLAGRPVA